MSVTTTRRKLAVVLGAGAGGDLRGVVDEAHADDASVRVIATGFPLVGDQTRAIQDALERAHELGVPLVAELAASPRSAADRVADDERVVVRCSRRDLRRFERARRRSR